MPQVNVALGGNVPDGKPGRGVPSRRTKRWLKRPVAARVAQGTGEMGMPLFFILPITVGAILLGATAADGRWWQWVGDNVMRGRQTWDSGALPSALPAHDVCMRLASGGP